MMCGSDDLRSFLQDSDAAFEDKKKRQEVLISGDSQLFTYQTFKSYMNMATETLTNYVWNTT